MWVVGVSCVWINVQMIGWVCVCVCVCVWGWVGGWVNGSVCMCGWVGLCVGA